MAEKRRYVLPGDYAMRGDRVPTGKPGDLSQLGRTDPLTREASWHWGGHRDRTPEEEEELRKDYNEAMRREFRQFEDVGAYEKTKKKKLVQMLKDED